MARTMHSKKHEFLKVIRADLEIAMPGRVNAIRAILYYLRFLGVRAVIRYRIAAVLYSRGYRQVAWILAARTFSLTGADLPPDAKIGPGLHLPHPVGVVVGHGCEIGSDCTILQGVTLGERYARERHEYPVIGDKVVIGAGAKLLGGIQIGSNARIGANAVVLTDIPAGCTAAGIPAAVVRRSGRHSAVEAR